MGWSESHYDKRLHGSLTEFFFGPTQPDGTHVNASGTVTEIAAHALVNLKVLYVVLRSRAQNDLAFGPWEAVIVLVSFSQGCVRYKSLTEQCGPAEKSAPLSILDTLDRLSPLPDLTPHVQRTRARIEEELRDRQAGPSDDPENALSTLDLRRTLERLDPHQRAREWRAACRAVHSARQATPRVHSGDEVTFARPVRFTNGEVHQTFTVLRSGGRTLFEAGGLAYRIRKWRERPFEITRKDREMNTPTQPQDSLLTSAPDVTDRQSLAVIAALRRPEPQI